MASDTSMSCMKGAGVFVIDVDEVVVNSFKLSESSTRILESIARAWGVDKSSVIRLLIAAGLEAIEPRLEAAASVCRKTRNVTSLEPLRILLREYGVI